MQQSNFIAGIMKIRVIIVFLYIIFYSIILVFGTIQECNFWSKFSKCDRSFSHHEYCYETKPYGKTICCSEIIDFNITEIVNDMDFDEYCIEYSEAEYDLLLKKLFGITGILIFSIVIGFSIYFCRQNGLVLLVVQQVQTQSNTSRNGRAEEEGNYVLTLGKKNVKSCKTIYFNYLLCPLLKQDHKELVWIVQGLIHPNIL